MKNFVNHWATISLLLAAFVALIINFASFNFTQNILLALIVCLLLHFFEEFKFPGGFPYVGMKVLMNSNEKNPARWGANFLCTRSFLIASSKLFTIRGWSRPSSG